MNDTFHGTPHRRLATTLSALKARREAVAAPSEAARMRSRAFAPNPGALEMWLHTPQGLEAGAPLVVLLHGCSQTAEAFAIGSGWIELADRTGFAVLAPQQVSANNPNRCFNWFHMEDMRRGDGEPASIAAMVEDALNAHDLDPDRIYVTGLSAGGAMTAVMLAAYPDLFAGGAIIAGTPYGAARSVAQAFQIMQGRGGASASDLVALLADAGGASVELPPLSIWHGEADHVVRPENAAALARQWAAGQGLASEPGKILRHHGNIRSIWRNAAGAARIELNLVAGLGHGVPLETGGDIQLGRAGPYMLDAGLSSTLEIARFWGLAPQAADAPAMASWSPRAETRTFTPPAGGLADQVMSALAGVPPNVQAVIQEALTRGGLLRR